MCVACACCITFGSEEPDICALVQIAGTGPMRINGQPRALQDIFTEEFKSSSGDTIVVLCPEYSVSVAEFLRVREELSDHALVGRQLGRRIEILHVFPSLREEYVLIFGIDPFLFAGASISVAPMSRYRRPDLVFSAESLAEEASDLFESADGTATLFVRQAADGAVIARLVASESAASAVHDLGELTRQVTNGGIRTVNIRVDGMVPWGVVDQMASHLRLIPGVEIYVSAASVSESAPFAYHAAAEYVPPPPLLPQRTVVRRTDAPHEITSTSQEAERTRFESCFSRSPAAKSHDSR